jgi:hypothetical protein
VCGQHQVDIFCRRAIPLMLPWPRPSNVPPVVRASGVLQNISLEVYFDFGPFAEANDWLSLPGV